MGITCKESHRLGDSVNVVVLSDKGVFVYNRYVPSSEWDSDPQMVAAEIADYLKDKAPSIVASPPIQKAIVQLDDATIEAKLAEKAAEEAADSE